VAGVPADARTTARRGLLAAAGLALAGCASAPSPPPPPPPRPAPARPGAAAAAREQAAPLAEAAGRHARADRANWTDAEHRVDAFSRLDEIFPANVSARPAEAQPWRRGRAPPAALSAIDDYLARNPVTGLALARDDTLLVERYRYGRRDTHRLTSFGMARTLVAMLAGSALEDRRLRSIDDPAQTYASALAGSAYGGVPLRDLLTMRSGLRLRDEETGGDDTARLTRATLGGPGAGGSPGPGAAQALRDHDRRIAKPGQRWAYSAGDCYVLALAVRGALRRPLSDYFSERIWKPIGAEADASWLVDRSGQELGYTGFNAVLRDWARLGMLLARRGAIDSRQAIPAAWVREATRAQVGLRQTGRGYGYGYQTWVFADDDGSFALLGEHGQAMFVDPTRRLVMVNTAVGPARELGGSETVGLWRVLRRLA
jgi:CubicO group peptidase (beta-lactamase class C family)